MSVAGAEPLDLVVGKRQENPPASKKKRKTRSQRRKEKLAQANPVEKSGYDSRVVVKDNVNLVKYYKRQSFLREDEWDEFMEGLRTTLPASFRINAFDYGQAKYLRRLIQEPEFCRFLATQQDQPISEPNIEVAALSDEREKEVCEQNIYNATLSTKSPVLEALSWYPKQMGWQMNITRVDLRKVPLLQQLHKFLMAETDNGFISRQEAVSMIPPLVLDISRGQNVLDMCAAPGSKTAQLLEFLKFDIFDTGRHAQVQTEDLFDDGLVVANDVENKRCYMLVHQANRLNSPNCIIINEDASRLPNMKTLNDKNDECVIKFDRVLCDVPCSGDGTVRKNPDVWRKWTVGNANNFHGMQAKILKRGVELLKENGLLVYSTCSMNPVEDEAVIASILRASKGKVVLEDCAHKLTGLKYRPGVSKWVVMNRETEEVPSIDQVKPEQASQLYPSLFPPTEEEAEQFQLHKCIRMLPHIMNTGAFFVATLRKLSATLPWEETDTTSQVGCEVPKPKQPNQKRRRYGGFKEDPFFFLEADDPDWQSIKTSFGLSDKFPFNQLVYRCQSKRKRSLHLVSKRTRCFMVANKEEPGKLDSVKIINGGMRLFAKADSEAGFRICQDGVGEILPYVKDDLKVPVNKEDLVALLRRRTVPFEQLSATNHLRDKLKPGSIILIYSHQDKEDRFQLPLVAWRGDRTIALYVSNTYRVHLCAIVQLNIGELAPNQAQTKSSVDEVKEEEELDENGEREKQEERVVEEQQ